MYKTQAHVGTLVTCQSLNIWSKKVLGVKAPKKGRRLEKEKRLDMEALVPISRVSLGGERRVRI